MPRTKLPTWVRIVRERAAAYEAGIFGERTPIRSPRDVAALIAPRLELEEQECFVVICLDAQHRVLALSAITRGVVNSTLVHPREVFRIAIAMGASAIVTAHNHPSGDPTPSANDRLISEQLVAAGKLLDIPVHDNVIVGHGRYTSFAEAGLL